MGNLLFLALAALPLMVGATNSMSTGTNDAETADVIKDRKIKEEKITDRLHPEYIRCRREPVIGSRARMRNICMTNRQWEEYARTGNSDARSIVDDISKGGMRHQ